MPVELADILDTGFARFELTVGLWDGGVRLDKKPVRLFLFPPGIIDEVFERRLHFCLAGQ